MSNTGIEPHRMDHPAQRFYPLLLLLLLLLAGCTALDVERPVAEQATPAPIPTETVPAEESFSNPVMRHNFPDPAVIEVEGVYYAYATNASGRNVQVARSTDLVSWELLPDGKPALASWVRLSQPHVWAPEVIEADGRFLLYYTARDKESDRQCIGVATSDQPEGRYRDERDRPFICQVDEGGSIDAHPFRDIDGTLYLYWKNDGNCCGRPTYIYVQKLSPDGLSLIGEPQRLIRNDAPWEGTVIEAPTIWYRDGQYYLFYSANNYAGIEYAVGYALCESPLGPCEKYEDNPILSSLMTADPPVVGPGHQELIEVDGETWMLYHAWEVTSGGTRGDRRLLWLDRLEWRNGVPDVQGPSLTPQPLPGN